MSGRIFPLKEQQADAVDPRETVWLSASAGTGKTQVLSARVLRLLLEPHVDASQILCLTFTKAGAAEMANRVNEVLARWVRMPAVDLAGELAHIGAPVDPDTVARARTLFASVLDSPGGGLRIDTIHAFSQWLLSAFPEEAGLVPGTKAMDDRERDLLARKVLSDLLEDAERTGDEATLESLAELSRRLGADGAQGFLMRCAAARDLWFGTGAWQPPMRARINNVLGLPSEAGPANLAALCADDRFDVASLRDCQRINRAWSAKTGQGNADVIDAWLLAEPEARVEALDDLARVFLTQKGEPKSTTSLDKIDPGYAAAQSRVIGAIAAVADLRAMLDLAAFLDPTLTLGRRFALAWDEAKQREGLIDFDDQIRRAAQLLQRSETAQWIRFKLDRQFDHILIDEAQDTNRSQWDIIDALTDDFFDGVGQREGRVRTLFVVGDYKQAIFRFQGTSPENFRLARERVSARMDSTAENAETLRGLGEARRLREYGLGHNFRSTQPVLDFVDAAIERIGFEQFGLEKAPERHVGLGEHGQVVLWPPVAGDENADSGDDDSEPQNWISQPERLLADRIALQVRQWMREGFPLLRGRDGKPARRAGPGDVMVLVRKRRELAGLLVARLYAAGVPVAGVDRLRLGAPLAVQDLMAALRFAVQPADDLSLASLLVSPLVGWSQEDLLECGYRDPGVTLWRHLRDSEDARSRAAVSRLRDMLARVDFQTPQALLHWMLVGPWRGRAKLLARLGREAADPIDELLNAAQNYEAAHTASLQGFIQWFDAGDGELKREAEGAGGQVRVMTVHGSKGLQAPIVILADATGRIGNGRASDLALDEVVAGEPTGRAMPLPPLSGQERVGIVADAAEEAALEEAREHWRLLYVAMTRAEEALFVGGALGTRDKGEPPEESWYAHLAPLFADAPAIEEWPWGAVQRLGAMPDVPMERADEERAALPVLPHWATTPVGPEPRPPRPLAPSSAGEDEAPDPPLPPGVGKDAARRGVLIHALLERLPAVQPEMREASAAAWLDRQARDLAPADRSEITASALAVLSHPGFVEVFGPDALAEVPLAATVGGRVIAGTADRLLVRDEAVTVVDFKTARRPPTSVEEVPDATVRQMAAYVLALEAIYPGKRVEAALLYTQTPQMIALSDAALAQHKAALAGSQESFAG